MRNSQIKNFTDIKKLKAFLDSFNCLWGDCGLEYDEHDQPCGYLYSFKARNGSYIDSELDSLSVAKLLINVSFHIDKRGYINI